MPEPDSTLGEIASLLKTNRIKRVPVVQDGTVVGIVSRANLVEALARVMAQPLERTAENDPGELERIEAEFDEEWGLEKSPCKARAEAC
jgi:signal-transduction protein with cAMP-binding, CBS, and nucleotidyltransferase domain